MDFVQNDLNTLDLKVKVVWLRDKLEEVLSRFRDNKPLLILSYSPGFLSLSDEWYPIDFPFCETKYPYNTTGCAYGPRRIVKLVSEKLANVAADAFDVSNVTCTYNVDIIEQLCESITCFEAKVV